MATRIAGLQIDLSARTARFSEGLQRAQKRMQDFQKRAVSLNETFQRMTAVAQKAAVVYGALSGAITLATRRTAEYAAQIKDVADQTGFAIETMQQLRFAVEQSAGDFQSLMSALRAFNRRTAEAARGNQSFLGGFERLGFTQEQVRAGLQDMEGFLLQVADRVAELGTTAEQSAILMTVMGDAGRRLVPFMSQGAEGIRELMEQARELGLVMDETQIRRLAAFNDRVDILGRRFAATGREIGYMFLPAVEAVIGLIEDATSVIQNMDPTLRSHVVRWTVVVGAVLGAIGVFGTLGRALSAVASGLATFGQIVLLAFSPLFLKLALAGAAIYAFWLAWERDWVGIRSAAEAAWEKIEPIIQAVGAGLQSTWEWVLDVAPDLWDWVKGTVEIIGDHISTAWDWTTGQLSTFVQWIRDTAAPWFGAAVSTAWDWTVSATGLAYEWVRDNVMPFINRVGETLNTTWSWTVEMSGQFFDWLKDTAWPRLVSVTSTLWHWTVDFFGTFFHWLKDTAWPWLGETVKTTWDWVVGTVSNFLNWIRGEAALWIDGQVSTGWDWTVGVVDSFLTWIKDTAAPWIGDTVRTVWSWRINVPQWWERFLNWITGRADASTLGALERIERATGFAGMADLLEAIYRAEGGAAARVPYGMTGFEETGRRFEREINQQRFQQILAETGIREGSEDFFAAAAAVSVLHYWDTFKQQFPEIGERTFAEIAPEMQRLFIEHMGRGFAPPSAHRLNVNWAPNVIGILGIPGGSYQSGTPWTGWGPLDEVAGVVHRREAVIPWDVLRRGPAAVLEFLGMPGFQSGYVPAAVGGLTGVALTEPDPGFIARLVESVVGGLESRGIIDTETASGLRELFEGLTTVVGSLYDRARELWDSLGQVDDRFEEALAQVRRFQEELDELGDVTLQAVLAARARIERLEDLVEIEGLISRTTGQAFDEVRFRAEELSRAIIQTARAMFEAGESAEAVAEVIAPWVEQLEPLQRQLEAQDAVATALERLAARLSEVDAGLASLVRSLRWEMGRGFRLDIAGLIQSAIVFAVDLLVDLFDSGAQELRQRLADVPDPGQDILSIADTFRRYSDLDRNIAERQQLLQDLYRQQQAITTRTAGGAAAGGLLGWLVGGPIGAAIGILLGGAVGQASAERDLRPQIEATEQQIRELEARIQGAVTDLIQALGIAADDFAAGIVAAFQEADIAGFSERLRESVRDSIRQAMIQAFVAQVLEPQIMALAEMVQDAFLRGAPLDMAAIDAQIESIVRVSEQLYDRFEDLGLSVEKATERFRELTVNVPLGRRVLQALRFRSSTPADIPHFQTGGVMRRDGLAYLHRGEVVLTPEQAEAIGGGGAMVFTGNITVVANDPIEFERQLRQYMRRESLRRTGNPAALERVRR